MKLETALTRTRDEIAEIENRRAALIARRDGLVVKLRTAAEPLSTRAVAELAGISHPRVTQLEAEARSRAGNGAE